MKYSAFFLFIIALSAACNRKSAIYPSAEVSYLSNESTSDEMALQARGFANKKDDAPDDAERRAFENLLFKGIPGSAHALPFIKETNARNKFKKYFDDFFEKKEYRNFLTFSNIIQEPVKEKRTNQFITLVSVRINIKSLRRELEQKQIIPKFGL